MRCGEKALSCTLAAVVFAIVAQATIADSTGNPYQAIVERNVFGLKPPPPPPSNEPPKPPAPKITLTGITTILGSKQALLTVELPPKPGTPPKAEPMILSEGERQNEVEVLEIDDVANTIKVNNYGEVMTVALEKQKDSPKPAGQPVFTGYSPPSPAAGGVPPSPGAYPPPADGSIPGAPAGIKTLPIRTLRLPQAGGVPPPPPSPVPPPAS